MHVLNMELVFAYKTFVWLEKKMLYALTLFQFKVILLHA